MKSSHISPTIRNVSAAFALLSPLLCAPAAHAWSPKKAPLMTKWAAQVDPKAPLPEYPRPQLVRKDWINLNGIWEFQPGNAADATPTGKKLSREILVPYPVESALSGVMEHHDRLWYRRSFTVPQNWRGQQLKLNFGAVDYEAEVFVNGKSVGTHKGGYEQFSYDITPFLKGNGPQELIVRVFDPTELGGQPRGKQTSKSRGIMYTPTSGIWQTVWLEPVAKNSIANVHMVPDIDAGVVRMTVAAPNATAKTSVLVRIKDGAKVIQSVRVAANKAVAIPVANAKLWSPDSPFLYNVDVTLNENNKRTDGVSSYFGMRKISLGKADGFQRILLNNKFTFQMGMLDQGFWPDGIYTAPTDEALASDIVTAKKLGFNMLRKHIKVEPARWYYHADKLGLMVWQDMPSGNSYTNDSGLTDPPPLDKVAFEKQLNQVVRSHWNSPSIVMWVIFNEGQGYYDPQRLVDTAKKLDPSRLVSRNSGFGFEKDIAMSDIAAIHSYPKPAAPAVSDTQGMVCGEYGGIGYVIDGHTWNGGGWGYATVFNAQAYEETYGEYTGYLKDFRDKKGLSGAVYTQITDVEGECNGLLTYDRLMKADPAQIRLANAFKYPSPVYTAYLPTSQDASQTYQYTFEKPADGWSDANFAGAQNWKTGPGGFGTKNTPNIGKLGTEWNTPDIWVRRTFTLPQLTPEQLKQLVIRNYHDDAIEVYLNGVLAYSNDGYTSTYDSSKISDAALAALKIGGENVLTAHCHQNGGGQYLDIGVALKTLPKVAN